MSEWWLVFCCVILALLALPVMIYPFRKTKPLLFMAKALLMTTLFLAYWRWGAWPAWQNYVHQQANKQRIEAILATIKSPLELIDRLKARLNEDPKQARGWYLLGRLYASQGQWQKAAEAFSTAHQLSPDDESATVNYAQSLWELNHQHFEAQIQALLKALLQKNPKQPDALALLAIVAFKDHHYQQAIDYWQRLLHLAPEQSEEAEMIRKAIARAEANLDFSF